MTLLEVSRGDLAQLLGVDVRSITNFVREGMPKTTRGSYAPGACIRWYVERECAREREKERARHSQGLSELDLARQRKLVAEAQEAELRVARMLGSVIPADVHEETVGLLADRLLAVLQNVPGNYGLRLEEVGVPAARAEAVLEAIALELTTALRGVADDFEADAAAIGDEDVSALCDIDSPVSPACN